MAFGLAVYASTGSLPYATQDSLLAVGQTLPDGVPTRRVTLKGFRFTYMSSSPFTKLLGANTVYFSRNHATPGCYRSRRNPGCRRSRRSALAGTFLSRARSPLEENSCVQKQFSLRFQRVGLCRLGRVIGDSNPLGFASRDRNGSAIGMC